MSFWYTNGNVQLKLEGYIDEIEDMFEQEGDEDGEDEEYEDDDPDTDETDEDLKPPEGKSLDSFLVFHISYFIFHIL